MVWATTATTSEMLASFCSILQVPAVSSPWSSSVLYYQQKVLRSKRSQEKKKLSKRIVMTHDAKNDQHLQVVIFC